MRNEEISRGDGPMVHANIGRLAGDLPRPKDDMKRHDIAIRVEAKPRVPNTPVEINAAGGGVVHGDMAVDQRRDHALGFHFTPAIGI